MGDRYGTPITPGDAVLYWPDTRSTSVGATVHRVIDDECYLVKVDHAQLAEARSWELEFLSGWDDVFDPVDL